MRGSPPMMSRVFTLLSCIAAGSTLWGGAAADAGDIGCGWLDGFVLAGLNGEGTSAAGGSNGELVVAGAFNVAGPNWANGAALWSGSAWSNAQLTDIERYERLARVHSLSIAGQQRIVGVVQGLGDLGTESA